MNVDQRREIHLLYLDLRDIVVIVKSMDIEHMNIDHQKNGQIEGRTIHQRKYVQFIIRLDM